MILPPATRYLLAHSDRSVLKLKCIHTTSIMYLNRNKITACNVDVVSSRMHL